MSIPPRIAVSPDEIQRVVTKFYAKVRKDPVLGKVFSAHVQDWPEHELKIAAFWRNAILHERSYDGNPMQKHMAAGNVEASHFAIWLASFDEVLRAELCEHQAKQWSALVHRIGQGLRFGIEHYQREVGEVPNLGT